LVNLFAAVVALIALMVVAQPPDEEHEFGHDKAEYFSSGFEGALILIAAAGISITAIGRLLEPRPIEQAGLGLAISLAASLVNLGVAQVLLRAARRYESITLEADARHLMTDVWTSAGVLIGIVAVTLSGWLWLDPVIALAVAANIVWMGVRLVRRSLLGLLDTALPPAERATILAIFERYCEEGVHTHALRTRQSGARRFITVHVLVPGSWTVSRGHDMLERIEQDICQALPHASIITHLEPIDDPASWQDMGLERVVERET
jgi:cation diffusion facilitator family transporter